jgi:hypothetical protein
MFCLGVSRAAVFAEPAVTKVEEMVGLVHENQESESRSQESEVRSQKSGVRIQESESSF